MAVINGRFGGMQCFSANLVKGHVIGQPGGQAGHSQATCRPMVGGDRVFFCLPSGVARMPFKET